MKKYVKPEISQIQLDEEICAGKICGEGDSWATSTKSGSEWTLCVHFPYYFNRNNRNRYGYSGYGPCFDVELKGKHSIVFEKNTSVTYCPDNDTYYGCGWMNYNGGANGNCHYFGNVYIDGHLITPDYPGDTDIRVYNKANWDKLPK